MTAFTPHLPTHSLAAYCSSDFRVISGAHEGDGISFADDLVLDDVYRLSKNAKIDKVNLLHTASSGHKLVRQSCKGHPNTGLHLDCAITLMGAGSPVIDALILVEVAATGHAENVFLLPLASINSDTDYRLVGISRTTAEEKLAQVTCVSFARGTHITIANGMQRPVEELSPGDAVLTRDDGIQPIRRIEQTTRRAYGEFAPICIASGTLNNAHDLVVSPDHRLFVYHRASGLSTDRTELLVKARDLVNGTSVRVQQGGFIEHYQLLFDRNQIVYAEGIATETMPVDAHRATLRDKPAMKDVITFPRPLRAPTGLVLKSAPRARTDRIALLRGMSNG